MKQFVVILGFLIASIIAAPNSVKSPFQPHLGDNIASGIQASIQDHPWQVSLLLDDEPICGGALIAPRVLLTAAHCVESDVVSDVSKLKIRSGSSLPNAGGSLVQAFKVITHEMYQGSRKYSPEYDIAVVHLEEEAAEDVAIPLWDLKLPAEVPGEISAWGPTKYGFDQLKTLTGPLVEEQHCQEMIDIAASEKIGCVRLETVEEECEIIGGDPLVIEGKLAGIMSFGANCAGEDTPAVFAKVPEYREWIKTNAGI